MNPWLQRNPPPPSSGRGVMTRRSALVLFAAAVLGYLADHGGCAAY